ncbi:transposase [Antrihabitans cavernicola]|uniref:Transposase n=1 Tax=Antrihabitans cavernicola TaxID=2495913 RepID=A0A5A7SIU4_9NOCA|nr:transposase [Spelaeibacter cavernicola]
MPTEISIGRCRSTRRSRESISTARTSRDSERSSGYSNLDVESADQGPLPFSWRADHRDPFGLRRHGRALAVLIGPGQGHDGTMLASLLDGIRVPRSGGRVTRTRPDRVRADKAYASPVNRKLLRANHITAVIPGEYRPLVVVGWIVNR